MCIRVHLGHHSAKGDKVLFRQLANQGYSKTYYTLTALLAKYQNAPS